MYQSAIFTVRKASGQKRAVLDLRSINDTLEPFLLQQLGQAWPGGTIN
jgi:hypothetical protein